MSRLGGSARDVRGPHQELLLPRCEVAAVARGVVLLHYVKIVCSDLIVLLEGACCQQTMVSAAPPTCRCGRAAPPPKARPLSRRNLAQACTQRPNSSSYNSFLLSYRGAGGQELRGGRAAAAGRRVAVGGGAAAAELGRRFRLPRRGSPEVWVVCGRERVARKKRFGVHLIAHGRLVVEVGQAAQPAAALQQRGILDLAGRSGKGPPARGSEIVCSAAGRGV